jgi:hypothetical protein
MGATPRRRPTLKRTSVFLTADQLAHLAARSNESGVPIAVMIRRAVEAYLAAPAAGPRGRR